MNFVLNQDEWTLNVEEVNCKRQYVISYIFIWNQRTAYTLDAFSWDKMLKNRRCKLPGGLVVRIRRSHRRGRGSIPRLGNIFVQWKRAILHQTFPAYT